MVQNVALRLSKPFPDVALMYRFFGKQRRLNGKCTSRPNASSQKREGPVATAVSSTGLRKDHPPVVCDEDGDHEFIVIDDTEDEDDTETILVKAEGAAGKLATPEAVSTTRRGGFVLYSRLLSYDLRLDTIGMTGSSIANINHIYSLAARFAMCRDRLRSASRPFANDPKAAKLMSVVDELSLIGEGFSEVFAGVDIDCLEALVS